MISHHIERVVAMVERRGACVHLHAHDLGFEGGLYRSETKEIFLNVPDAKRALETLVHEVGHWIGYEKNPRPYSYQRERQAFVYGWHFAKLHSLPITRADWIAAERERRANA